MWNWAKISLLRKKCSKRLFIYFYNSILQFESFLEVMLYLCPIYNRVKKEIFSHVDKLCLIFTAIVILVKQRVKQLPQHSANPLCHQAFTVWAFISKTLPDEKCQKTKIRLLMTTYFHNVYFFFEVFQCK